MITSGFNTTVSLMAPVYNVASYLQCRIQGMFGQTYRTQRVILANDESTGEPGSPCDEVLHKIGRHAVEHGLL